jgi:hypothetical protein
MRRLDAALLPLHQGHTPRGLGVNKGGKNLRGRVLRLDDGRFQSEPFCQTAHRRPRTPPRSIPRKPRVGPIGPRPSRPGLVDAATRRYIVVLFCRPLHCFFSLFVSFRIVPKSFHFFHRPPRASIAPCPGSRELDFPICASSATIWSSCYGYSRKPWRVRDCVLVSPFPPVLWLTPTCVSMFPVILFNPSSCTILSFYICLSICCIFCALTCPIPWFVQLSPQSSQPDEPVHSFID